MLTLIENGCVILPSGKLLNHTVAVEDTKIVGILQSNCVPKEFSYPKFRVDATNKYISPGFIDIHVHGGGGVEANCGTVEDVIQMATAHAKYGTTSIVPTTFASPLEDIYKTIDSVKKAQEICDSSNILGVHLEGPYFSISQSGAQNPEFIIEPKKEDYIPLLDYWDGILVMGVAVERKGALELGAELHKRGILASVAHSDATFEEVEKALQYGYTDVTHIYSACSTVKRVNAYRVAGVVEAGLYFDDMTVQIISDGKHLPASLLKFIYKCKGPEKIALVTDGLCAAANKMEEGQVIHQANGIDMIYDDGVMKLMDKQSFAGSAATTNALVRNMYKLADVPIYSAVRMASLTPATMLNIDNKKGKIAIGMDADILVFDDNIDLDMVMVMGKIN